MSTGTAGAAAPGTLASEPRRSRAYAWRRARSRIPVWHLLWLLVGAVVFLVPLYALVQYSFSGLARGQSPFHWYLTVFDDPQFATSFWLSLQIALETVAIGLVLMVPTAFWVHIRLPKLRPAMDLVSVLPFVVPPIVLIVGLIAFLRPFAWLIDRPEVLALIYVVFALPFLYRSLDAGLRAIDLKTLTEAAESLGSSLTRTLFRVILPNLRAAIIGGALLTVAIAMGEFTIASLLAFNTYPVYIYNIGTSQSYEAGALSVISLLLTWGAMLALFVIGQGGRTATQTGVIK